MKEKRIAFIMPCYLGGGAERVTDILASGLSELYGYKTTIMVYLTKPEYVATGRKRGLDIELLPGSESADNTAVFHDPDFTLKVGKLLKQGGYSVAIMCMLPLCDISILRREAPDCRLLFHLHGKPLFEVKDRLFLKNINASRTMAIWRRVRERLFHIYRHRIEDYYLKLYNEVDGFITLCDSYRHEIERIVDATSQNSHAVAMYNPLADHSASSSSSYDESHGKTVLYVGRLSYVDKRPDRLLRIWAGVVPEFPDWCLKIVGDGPYREEMERMVHDLGIAGSVEFCGYAADPSPYYAEASILCLTSEFEGWGMVLAEGQRAGVWPVSFDMCAGVRELVGTDGTRGTLVSPYSEKKYARVLRALMSAPERIAALRPAMMASTDKYSAGEVIAGWDRYLERITARDISGRGS